MMNGQQRLARAIELKRQSIPLIREEIHYMEERYCLFRMLERLEARIKKGNFDSDTSEKIDCIRRILGI